MASKGGHWKSGRFVAPRGSTRAATDSGGGRGATGAGISRMLRGLRDSDINYIRDPGSFREGSFATIHGVYREQLSKGRSATHVASKVLDPVRLDVEAGGRIHVRDGRHRLAVAREMGAKKIRAQVTEYGPRGGIRTQRTVVIPLRD